MYLEMVLPPPNSWEIWMPGDLFAKLAKNQYVSLHVFTAVVVCTFWGSALSWMSS